MQGVMLSDVASSVKAVSAYLIPILLISWILRSRRNHSKSVSGPRIAKLTGLWKLAQVYNGTYTKTLRDLHNKHGWLVQIGPYEYSITHIQLTNQWVKLESLKPRTEETLRTALNMSNIFRYEASIDKCNHALLKHLATYAETGEGVDMDDLIARYAFDCLICTTTGAAAGFLDRKLDISGLTEAMNNWKFQSILYGSYLRLHPIISKILRWFGVKKDLESLLHEHLDIDSGDDSPCVQDQMREASQESPLPSKDILEACIALMVSRADPVITHILNSLYYVFQDTELAEAVRDEIAKVELSQPPTLKELINMKPRMPLLHAVLQESLRLTHLPIDELRYTSPEEGIIMWSGERVLQSCTICCEPSVVHLDPKLFGVNARAFDPTRWLDNPKIARGFRNHMIAFGAGTNLCPGKELHLSIVAKVFTQIIATFNIEMASVDSITSPIYTTFKDANNKDVYAKVFFASKDLKTSWLESGFPLRATAQVFTPEIKSVTKGSEQSVSNTSTSPTLSIASTVKSSEVSGIIISWTDEQLLEDVIGRDTTNELINRFDPSQRMGGQPMLRTRPIHSSRDRYLLHDVINRVWDGRLIHETSGKDNSMYIWAQGSKVPKWVEQLHANRQLKDRKKAFNEKSTSNKVTSTAATKSAPVNAPRPVNSVWSTFAQDENTRYGKIAAMTGDEYIASEREKAEARGEKKEAEKGSHTFKETFKQTAPTTTNGNINGIHQEVIANGTATAVDMATNAEPKKAALPPHLRTKATVPPHLRNKSVDAKQKAAVEDANTKIDDNKIAEKAEVNGTDSDGEKSVWVAAGLPTPCSSE